MVDWTTDVVRSRCKLQRGSAPHVVVEHDYPICAECRLDDIGTFGVVAPLHVTLIVETPYSCRPPTELRAVLIQREAVAVAYVRDLQRMTCKARRLRFAALRCLAPIGERSIDTWEQKIDLR